MEPYHKCVLQVANRFVDKMISVCHGPYRQERARDRKKGFSREKLRAALVVGIFDYVSLKKVAEVYGVSYGLLRKWLCEDDFKLVVDCSSKMLVDWYYNEPTVLELMKKNKLSEIYGYYKQYDDKN